jgi:tetratricopeptide (TPR) repeat protein
MAVFKCKMCGGSLEIESGATVATCPYCDSQQTLPKLDDDKMSRLYERANHFRRNNDFDKACAIFEEILNEDTRDAEAYWSLVLCRYGIEYVVDPTTNRRIPTINRVQYTSIFDDDNYRSALEYADFSQKVIYENEAKIINNIQKRILDISAKEEPFDVFICYKETDDSGKRTRDSVYANDLYHELTKEGFKVFFARVTLEDKLGEAYEPYIFAALNSSKVMVVLGTKPEYFSAVWVKNEWSRFLALIKKGEKKNLIPAYSGMDPYDLPEEFAHLQAQDMTKLGFMPDLVRGIKKLVGKEEEAPKVTAEPQAIKAAAEIAPLEKRVKIFIDNGDWSSAEIYCEKILDIDPENGNAYVYKLLVSQNVTTIEDLAYMNSYFGSTVYYKNAIRYADEETAQRIIACNNKVKERMQLRADRDRRRTELNNSRQAVEAKIEQQLQAKHRLEGEIELAKNAGKTDAKKLAITTLVFFAMIFVAFIGMMVYLAALVADGYGNSSGAEALIPFLIVIILYLVFNAKLCKARGTSRALVLLNFVTYMIYGAGYSVYVLFKEHKKTTGRNANVNDLQASLAAINAEIDTSRSALSNINKAIADFNNN